MTEVRHVASWYTYNRQNTVYIGRPSKWGNPFKIGPDGDRQEVLAKYSQWFHSPERAQLREDAKKELKGKTLLCYCKPSPCHGDVLKVYVDNAD